MSLSPHSPGELAVITNVTSTVQQLQLPVNAYIADVSRDPLQLPNHMHALSEPNHFLKHQVYGRVRYPVWWGHFSSTRDLQEFLRTIEAGFSQGRQSDSSLICNRFVISPELLAELVRSRLKDKDISEMFGCSERTIIRKRNEVGLEISARMRATSDETVNNHALRYLSDQNEIETGVLVTQGHLRDIGVPDTREQLHNVIKALQPDDYENRATQAIQRREYQVPITTLCGCGTSTVIWNLWDENSLSTPV